MYSLKQFHGKADKFGDLLIMSNDRPQSSLVRHAIDEWENEGGGTADAARTALVDIAGWQANNSVGWLGSHPGHDTPQNDETQTLVPAGEEDRILRCLGAAVMMRWNTIPTKLQREVFDTASSVGELLQAGALKGQIARFLHKHKVDDR
jgi:hypothetical protein